MKKTIALLLAAVLLCTIFPAGAFALDENSAPWTATVLNTGSETVPSRRMYVRPTEMTRQKLLVNKNGILRMRLHVDTDSLDTASISGGLYRDINLTDPVAFTDHSQRDADTIIVDYPVTAGEYYAAFSATSTDKTFSGVSVQVYYSNIPSANRTLSQNSGAAAIGITKAKQQNLLRFKAAKTGYITVDGDYNGQIQLLNSEKKAVSKNITMNTATKSVFGVKKGQTYYLKAISSRAAYNTATLRYTLTPTVGQGANKRTKATAMQQKKAYTALATAGNKQTEWYRFTLKSQQFAKLIVKMNGNDKMTVGIYTKKGKKLLSKTLTGAKDLNQSRILYPNKQNKLKQAPKGTYYVKVTTRKTASGICTLKWTADPIAVQIGKQEVTKKTYTLQKGKKKTLKVLASANAVTYQSKDKKIATVTKNGKVTAKKQGTVKIQITVTNKNGKKQSTWVKIKVTDPKKTAVSQISKPTEPRKIVGYTLDLAAYLDFIEQPSQSVLEEQGKKNGIYTFTDGTQYGTMRYEETFNGNTTVSPDITSDGFRSGYASYMPFYRSLLYFAGDKAELKAYLAKNGVQGNVRSAVMLYTDAYPLTIWVKVDQKDYFITLSELAEDVADKAYVYRLYSHSAYYEKFRQKDAKLIVNGQQINTAYAKMNNKTTLLPFVAVMQALGSEPVWNADKTALTFSFAGKDYTYDVAEGTLLADGEQDNLFAVAPGSSSDISVQNDEIVVSNTTLYFVLQKMHPAITMHIDYDNLTVEIR